MVHAGFVTWTIIITFFSLLSLIFPFFTSREKKKLSYCQKKIMAISARVMIEYFFIFIFSLIGRIHAETVGRLASQLWITAMATKKKKKTCNRCFIYLLV